MKNEMMAKIEQLEKEKNVIGYYAERAEEKPKEHERLMNKYKELNNKITSLKAELQAVTE